MKPLSSTKCLVGGLLVLLAGVSHTEFTSESEGLVEAISINETEFMQNLRLTAGGWVNAGVTYNANPGDKFNGSSGYYEMTAGLNWKPMGWMIIRPEVRYDWADKARAFDAGNKGDRFTFATDIIVKF